MPRLIVQDRRDLSAGTMAVSVAVKGSRSEVLDYVARAYPHFHVVSLG